MFFVVLGTGKERPAKTVLGRGSGKPNFGDPKRCHKSQPSDQTAGWSSLFGGFSEDLNSPSFAKFLGREGSPSETLPIVFQSYLPRFGLLDRILESKYLQTQAVWKPRAL